MAVQSSREEMEGWDVSEMVGVCSGLSHRWGYLICCGERGEGVGAGKVFVNWHHLSDLLLSCLVAIGAIGPHLAQQVSVNLAPICMRATIL